MAKAPRSPRKRAPKKRAPKRAKPATPKTETNAPDYVSELKAQLGRPRALVETDHLLSQIRQLAAMKCTKEEASAFLGVSHVTFGKFLKETPRAVEAWEMGKEIGKVSLRQMQWQSAKKGNIRMQIWLGIQMLGQANRINNQLTGPNGGPIQNVQSDMTPSQAAAAWAAVMNDGPG